MKIRTLEIVKPPVRLGKWYVLFAHLSNSKSNPGEKKLPSLLDSILRRCQSRQEPMKQESIWYANVTSLKVCACSGCRRLLSCLHIRSRHTKGAITVAVACAVIKKTTLLRHSKDFQLLSIIIQQNSRVLRRVVTRA